MRRLLFLFIAALAAYALWFLAYQPVDISSEKKILVKIGYVIQNQSHPLAFHFQADRQTERPGF